MTTCNSSSTLMTTMRVVMSTSASSCLAAPVLVVLRLVQALVRPSQLQLVAPPLPQPSLLVALRLQLSQLAAPPLLQPSLLALLRRQRSRRHRSLLCLGKLRHPTRVAKVLLARSSACTSSSLTACSLVWARVASLAQSSSSLVWE